MFRRKTYSLADVNNKQRIEERGRKGIRHSDNRLRVYSVCTQLKNV